MAGAAPVLLLPPAGVGRHLPGRVHRHARWPARSGSATALAQLPDGRFLVTSQTAVAARGARAIVVGGPRPDATADGTHPTVCGDSEEGLLGVTVDPQFATNGFVYLYYTRAVGGSCSTPGNGVRAAP